MTKEELQQIPTIGDLHKFGEAIVKAVGILVQPVLKNNPLEDPYLSISQIEAYTGFKRSAILKWLNTGKPDAKGNLVKLQYKLFAPGDKRVKLSVLEAYGDIGLEAPTPKSNLPRKKSAFVPANQPAKCA